MSEFTSEQFAGVVLQHRERKVSFDTQASTIVTLDRHRTAERGNCFAMARSMVQALLVTDLTDIGFMAYVPTQGGIHFVAAEMHENRLNTVGMNNDSHISERPLFQTGLDGVFGIEAPPITTAYKQIIAPEYSQIRSTKEGENTRTVLLGKARYMEDFAAEYFKDTHPDRWAVALRAANAVNGQLAKA